MNVRPAQDGRLKVGQIVYLRARVVSIPAPDGAVLDCEIVAPPETIEIDSLEGVYVQAPARG